VKWLGVYDKNGWHPAVQPGPVRPLFVWPHQARDMDALRQPEPALWPRR
jgi:hypothetical protein